MANQLFKGDLAEVSFGKETGLRVDGKDSEANWTHTSITGNTSLITLGDDEYWSASGPDLLIPDNILVGCTMRINGSGNYSADDYAATKRTYYITANDTALGQITVQPALLTAAGTATADDDDLIIYFYRCPTVDRGMTTASQYSKTDQFIGLLNEFALPEPQIDVRKQHVVGLGRDVNVITSGRETLSGGSMQTNAHTLRWLKYALGGHTAKSQGEFAYSTVAGTLIGAAPLNIKAVGSGAKYASQLVASPYTVDDAISALAGLTLTGSSATGNFLLGALTDADTATDITFDTSNYNIHFENVGTAGIFKVLSATGAVLYGYYGGASGRVLSSCGDIDTGALARAQTADMAVYLLGNVVNNVSAGDIRIEIGSDNVAKFTAGTSYVQIIDKEKFTIPGQDNAVTSRQIYKNEIRRVIALGTASGDDADFIYVEEPFTFDHLATSCGVERLQYYGSSSNRGSPNILNATKELQMGVVHTLFGHDVLPSFTIEQSFRQKDVEQDANQLLRLYSGCKVTDATVGADTEGEVKLDVNFEAARHYTSTTNTMLPHRMFDNTAESAINRKMSGIAVSGEKPYLFQDVSVEVFGRPVLRGTEFSLTVANSTESRWFIRGYEGPSTDNDQVTHGATQLPMDITEGKREYTFTLKAMVEDDRMWEELRTRRHHRNTNDITLTLIKVGSNATRETATITLEDYTILKADHQVPSDKGPVYAELELVVRHMKVEETSPYYIL